MSSRRLRGGAPEARSGGGQPPDKQERGTAKPSLPAPPEPRAAGEFFGSRRRPPAAAPPLQQHDLLPAVAARIIAACGIAPDAQVIDAGAGTGALTAALIAAGASVTAIELDPARVAALRTRFASEARVRVVSGDVLRAPLPEGRWRVVANPPFQHTAALLRRWLLRGAPAAFDLVLQREAARKLCGGELGHTRSSALLGCAGAARIAFNLVRTDTAPPSRVDLALWSWRRAADAPRADELARIDQLLERAFAGPHTVADALRGLSTPTILRRQAAEHGWRPEQHPRALPSSAWRALAAHLALCGKLG